MKSSFYVYRITKSLTLLLAAFAFTLTTANARIGENKNALESRLLSKSNGAYQYVSKEERLREALELPYNNLFLLFPKDANTFFYFKRPDTTLTTNSDVIQQHDLYGWEVQITYLDNTSNIEFYRRHGDPMTTEELKALMNLIASEKEGRHWVANNFVQVNRDWDIKVKDGIPHKIFKDDKGNIIESTKEKAVKLDYILPLASERFIYVELPDEVTSSANFQQSLQFQLMELHTRQAYEKYRNYIAKQSQTSASKTAPSSVKKSNSSSSKNNSSSYSSNQQRVNRFDATTQRGIESLFYDIEQNSKKATILNYQLENVFYGGNPIEKIEKEPRIIMKIPLQPDTAFGYNYELSDGSIRARIYKNAILFIDAAFDKSLRKNIEDLYKKQTQVRESEAESSLNRF